MRNKVFEKISQVDSLRYDLYHNDPKHIPYSKKKAIQERLVTKLSILKKHIIESLLCQINKKRSILEELSE